MTESVFVAKYWHFYKTAEKRRFDYYLKGNSKSQFSSTFSYDAATDSMLYVDADENGKWKDTWYLQYRKGFGIAEWRDTYPSGQTKTFSTPIGWGDTELIGSTYSNVPRVDILRTWPPCLPLTGQQYVNYEAVLPTFKLRDGKVYKDVLQMLYQQQFGKTRGGARGWFAAGVGPIALEWVAPDDKGNIVVTDRYHAKVTST